MGVEYEKDGKVMPEREVGDSFEEASPRSSVRGCRPRQSATSYRSTFWSRLHGAGYS